MNPADIDLFALLKRLHLPTVARVLPELEVRAAREGMSHRDFVAILVAEEVAHRNDTRVHKAVRNAQFPSTKTIEEFDFVFQASIRRQALGPWLGPEFVSEGRNLILSGKPGRGKTHLAIALAHKAIQNGYDARFVTASALIDELCAASSAGRQREATAAYVAPDVSDPSRFAQFDPSRGAQIRADRVPRRTSRSSEPVPGELVAVSGIRGR